MPTYILSETDYAEATHRVAQIGEIASSREPLAKVRAAEYAFTLLRMFASWSDATMIWRAKVFDAVIAHDLSALVLRHAADNGFIL